MYKRVIALSEWVQHKSLFLLGPRQTGKSTLLKTTFPGVRYIDLLQADIFRDYSANPELLRERMRPQDRIIVIDEVQKLPVLLDEAHGLIERDKRLRFVFTGSSSRKLKRGNANLLAGRAWFARLHPLVAPEVEFEKLQQRLEKGGLPAIFDSQYPHEDLKAYVGSYLQEEIRAEGLARTIEPFSRFLTVAGLTNGEIINFTSVANDAQVPARTVREYYQVLEDTLVAHVLPPFRETRKRKPTATAKFYWFDVGVAQALAQRRELAVGTSEYGRALEHQIFLELRAYLDYRRSDQPLTFWRTTTHQEVDFVVGNRVAIEVKGTGRVTSSDLKGLFALKEETPLRRMIVVCRERDARRTEEGVDILPIKEFLKLLWSDKLLQP